MRGKLRGVTVAATRRSFVHRSLAAAAAVGAGAWAAQWRTPVALAAGEKVLEEAKSDYNHIVVTEQGVVRTMYFVVNGTHYIESRLNRGHEDSLDLDYTRTMMSAFLVQPQVKRFLMIGFGGGQITNYLFRKFEGIEIDAVDIDPEVIRLARKYFDVPDSPRYRTHAADGRVFVEDSADQRWDVILLDAFRGVFVPMHLKTVEYYQQLAQHLTPDGVVAANLHSRTEAYKHDRNTFAAVFDRVYPFYSESKRQTAFVASNSKRLVTPYELRANARRLQPKFDFDLTGVAARWYLETNWDTTAAVLRDDFPRGETNEAAKRHNKRP